jgi:hypothetical protein
VDVPFTATYQYQVPLLAAFGPPKVFGYLLNLPPLGPAGTNYNPLLGPTANCLAAYGDRRGCVVRRRCGWRRWIHPQIALGHTGTSLPDLQHPHSEVE